MFDFIIAMLILSLMSVLAGFAGMVTGASEITQICCVALVLFMVLGISTSVTAYRRHLPL